MKRSTIQAAFTLIELLTVMCIISVLAGMALPVYKTVMLNGKQTAAMNSARQVSMSLRLYSNDNDGAYPLNTNSYGETIKTSNDAFRSLIPTYLDSEKVFAVGGSKAGPSADNNITDATHILQPGENHWAFVEGLSVSSNSNWPLIVDHTDGSGYYTDQENQLGGTWQGTKGICVNTDGSSHITALQGTGKQRFLPRFDDKTKNALAVQDYMGTGVTLLEPAH